ncbi:TolC family protein [Mucilaginibacter daejeonensis]|uniref:TolC family protein n=1 Tax=Mucilaginibacter daejeonensis TaxID=398049 RepID=UPI001D173A7F|nr:TolC family protein [Mucilaginibacter daejeonensis]UEG54584.1 TolC family protein [Mucilaginibacter daejeonensis]
MFSRISISVYVFAACMASAIPALAQQTVALSMKEAVDLGVKNYPAILAKKNQVNSSKASLQAARNEYLPDVTFSAQNAYGTINGQNGPLVGYRGLAVSSSGPALPNQSWDAAFGALYLTNVNWDFFAFGRAKERIKVQKQTVGRDEADLGQQEFQHKIRVASAYLGVLAAQRLVKVQQDNLNRTMEIRRVIRARVTNGLNPGVDSSLALSEVSNARIQLTNAQQNEKEQVNQLSQYLGYDTPPADFVLDSTFVIRNPTNPNPSTTLAQGDHPYLRFYKDRIQVSDEQARYQKTFALPTFSLIGVFQGRGSGFGLPPAINRPVAVNSSYIDGINPTRANYLVGVATSWNFASLFRTKQQVRAQKFISAQYQNEYDLVDQQLRNQQALADSRITNALKNSQEAPIQIKTANEAYIQKVTLYKNGLATITDFQQALYTLYRAETNNYIAYNNVWQALLFKAASTGDFDLFINNF